MITPKLYYQPKGRMCATCKYIYRDCSFLNFDDMPPISKGDRDGTVVVRCTEFVKPEHY